ncbi:MAG: nitrilase-related carbon-nitrogen hydrolase [Promethearchaeota archaeon]
MILKIFIIAPGGVLCYSKDFFEQIDKDEEVISGFLKAISDFAKEIKGGDIKALIFRNFKLIYSYSIEFDFIFVIVIDKDDLEEEARIKVELMKKEFIVRYRSLLKNWTGNISIFKDFTNYIEENMFIPPKILLTGEDDVGKTTIMDLLPGDTIIEIDDNLNEIIRKTINLFDLKEIKQCIIQEINMEELILNSSVYKNLLDSVDIILIVSNSAASNLGRTKNLYLKLKPKVNKADFYVLANFQDLKDVAFEPKKIEETFDIKTYGFTAIKEDSKTKIIFIIKDLLKNSVLNRIKKEHIPTIEEEAILYSEEQPEYEKVDYVNIWNQIEEARVLERQGDHLAAAEKFSYAATQFKEMCSRVEYDKDKDELTAVSFLCRAWEAMEFAEVHENPERYLEAADLFNKASQHFTNNKIKLLALGNSAFCKALSLGCKFDKTSETSIKAEYYPKIKMLLRNAANLYQKGEFKSEADWALATSTYFDATWYIIRADEELNLDDKKKLLEIGSGVLKSAAKLFGKAGYKDKENEIYDRLNLIQKEEKIIISALSTISEPSISKTTIDLLVPSIPQNSFPVLKKEVEKRSEKNKYQLIYKDLVKDYQKIQRRECRVGIAQIGVSSTGDYLKEFYKEKVSGLLELRKDKIGEIGSKIKEMIEKAHANNVNILIFPEMTIDLNYGEFLEDLSNFAKLYEMYIIPGSFHNQETKKNISMVFGPDGILWEQEKHIPAIIHFKGKRFKEGIKTETIPRNTIICNTEFGRMAIAICRDFLDMDLRVELKNFEPPIDLMFNPAFTPVTADFKAAHFDARRSIYAYCFFVNIAEFGESLIYTPEKERIERIIPPKEENLIFKDVDLFKLRSERKKWEKLRKKDKRFIQSTR